MKIINIPLIVLVLVGFLSACGEKNAEFKVINNTDAVLNNVEVVTDSGSSFQIEKIKPGANHRVILDRSHVGTVDVFVEGNRCFSLKTEGSFGKVRIDAVPEQNEIEQDGGINSESLRSSP